MKTLLHFLDRLVSTFNAPVSNGHAMLVRQHCTHCGEETLCAVNVLRNSYQCASCGQNPHADPDQTASEADSAPVSVAA